MNHVCYFRHALALDERRVKFMPEYAYKGFQEASPDSRHTIPHTKEVWFAGTHSDMYVAIIDKYDSAALILCIAAEVMLRI